MPASVLEPMERRSHPAALNRRPLGPGVRQSILETIGNTPTVRVSSLAPEGIDLFVRLEAFNPLGSVKDRLAMGVIEAAERDGSLRPALFAELSEAIDAEEMETAASTPSFRFDAPGPAAPASDDAEPTEDAARFVEQSIAGPETPVVMFALEWLHPR